MKPYQLYIAKEIRETLQPFAELFESILIPESRRLRAGRISRKSLSHVIQELERGVEEKIGHALHPVIVCYAMRVCCHYYYSASDATKGNCQLEWQRRLFDKVYGLILKLEEYYKTDELLLLSL